MWSTKELFLFNELLYVQQVIYIFIENVIFIQQINIFIQRMN